MMNRTRNQRLKTGEHGFALVALLAGLTIILVMMATAVPAFRHELQRDQEEEMFWRGQQIARGLARFAIETGRYPNNLEELAEPFMDRRGQMLRIVRQSALRDPLAPPAKEDAKDGKKEEKTNWRAVRAGDPLINEFYQAYIAEMTRNPERRLQPPPQQLAQLAQITGGNVVGLNAPGTQAGPATSEFSKMKENEGPIYGVVSRSEREMIRNYFQISTYDHALFFAGVAVAINGIYNPIVLAAPVAPTGNQGRQNDPRCPNGGVYFEQDGKAFCGGVLNPGKLCRGPDGTTIPCPEGQK